MSFPEEMLNDIQELIEKSIVKKIYGSRSVPTFVRRGHSDLIQKIEKELEKSF